MPTTRSSSKRHTFPVREAQVLKLEFSPSIHGRHWTPRRFTPSVTFTRIVPPTPLNLPKGPPPPPADVEPDVTLMITERIGRDPISDMYYAKLVNNNNTPGDSDGGDQLFVRVTDLLTFSLDGPRVPQSSVEEGMATSHHTFTMVGDSPVVPRYYGMFACDMLYCTVFQDAGRFLTEEEKQSKDVQAEALEAVRVINAAKVGPHMWRWRFLTRGHDGKIKVADLSWNDIVGNIKPWQVENSGKTKEAIMEIQRRDSWCVDQVEELFECGERITV